MSAPRKTPRGWWIALAFVVASVLLAMFFAAPARAASPPAGTAIGNQASATYSDASLTVRTVTSNTVTTIVQQVASFTLTANGTKNASLGGLVSFPHTLTNTGNGNDSFTLGTSNTGGFSFTAVVLYADANGDGVPDNAIPITSTGTLASGAVFKFVAVGAVPPTVVATQTNTLTITATSVLTPGLSATNTDTTTATNKAVVYVTKAVDVIAGLPGTGPRTFTLTYTNVGNLTATNVTLTDLLPAGFTYVANSARWSGTGTTVLTDANAADSQSGVVYDWNVSAAGRVTAVIASVPPGTSGTLLFQVNVASGLAPGANSATQNTASYAYNDGSSNIAASPTNTVQFIVLANAAVGLTGATVASATQGSTVSFTNTVTDNGTGTDSFDMSFGAGNFPAGTTFSFFRADGATPLVDSNGNGTPDTGPVAAGASINVIVKAFLPPNATGGPYTQALSATSFTDATKTASASDVLTAITASTVDLTANTAGSGSPGFGPGPEGSAVVTNTAASASTTRFTLVVSNTSGIADTYNLQASTTSSFGAITLPTGWLVVFKDSTGAVLTNTGIVNAGATRTVYADVTIPPGTASGTSEIYFRALSPTSGAVDRLHAAVQVSAARGIVLTPSHTGQAYPGGSVVYVMTVANTGNVLEGDASASTVLLATTDTQSGFTSSIYWDKNQNGVLDSGDPVVSSLADLSGGSGGASTAAGLDPGERATLFLKVYAPSGAALGSADTTTITATTTGTIGGVAAPSAASATAVTTVIAGQLQLVKLQALDAACDGTADTAYAPTQITTGATPGACIRYQVTATNVGIADVTSVVINDTTPAGTTYHGTVAAAVTVGSVTPPTAGQAGTVQATIGTLAPGATAVLTFGVRIDP